MNPPPSIDTYLVREKIIKIIRDFFYKNNFHEIIPSILNEALPLEPNLKPFITTHEYGDPKKRFFLPLSPERSLKIMLAEGIGDCFAIGQSFRNYERTGPLHLHEFTMLEWYRKSATFIDIMNDVEILLSEINSRLQKKLELPIPFPRFSLNALFQEKVGLSLERLLASEGAIQKIAQKKELKTDGATWEELYDQLFVNEIESTLPLTPFFLIDFPARISPLCKTQASNPLFAERFELYIKGIEIGNGNTENTNVEAVRTSFNKQHKASGLPIDEVFLGALEKMNDAQYAGIGVGVNRLAMLYTDADIFV